METPIEKPVNTWLRTARRQRGLTQKQLAEHIDASERAVRSWEHGADPQPEYIARLCKFFEKTPEQLGFSKVVITQNEQEARNGPSQYAPGSLQRREKPHLLPTGGQTDPLVVASKFKEETVTIREEHHLSLAAGRNLLQRNEEHHQPREHALIEERRRMWMLRQVEMRIAEALVTLLDKQVPLSLSLRERPEAIQDPWRKVVWLPFKRPGSFLPAGSHISTIYDKAVHSFLLLGEPGAGKTTLLLELALTLIERAKHDHLSALPVVFRLSEWGNKLLSFEDFLVQELCIKYLVPRKLAQSWIENEQLILMLDGLNELAPERRTACIAAINTYHGKHSLVPIVVCCQTTEYFSQPARLSLNRAVTIQPLTAQQVNAYLAQEGADFASLQLALQQDSALQEVLSTPLMLNASIIAYQGYSPDELLAAKTQEERRAIIFAAYVERVLEQRPKKTYPARLVKEALAWLASQMQQRNQTEFSLERLQPDWLLDEKEQRRYRKTVLRLVIFLHCVVGGALSSWLKGGLKNGVVGSGNGILGFFGGGEGNSMLGWMAPGIGAGNQGGASLIIIFGIVVWLVSILVGNPSLPLITPEAIGHGLRNGLRTGMFTGIFATAIATIYFTLLGGIAYGVQFGFGIGFFLGICAGLIDGLMAGLRSGQESPREKASILERGIDGLIFGAGGALGFMVVAFLLQVSIRSTFIYGGVWALFFLLAYGFGGGSRLFPLGQTIQPAERVSWSWGQVHADLLSNGKKSLLAALVTVASVSVAIGATTSIFHANPIYGLRYGAVFGIISGLIVGCAALLTSMLKSGWSSETLPQDQRITPNEGITRSGRNALISASVFAPIGGIASGLACGVGFGLVGGLTTWPVMGMAFALMLTIMFWSIAFIAHGGMAWIAHYTLRFLLWRSGRIPWKYVHFLNSAATSALLRRVGGGYLFFHGLLQEYFAHLHHRGGSSQQ